MSTTLAKEKSKFEQGEPSEELKPWLRRFGRFGHMVKGSVYTMLGLLAFMASIGAGGKAQGTKGLFQSLASIPMGEVLLWIIGTGLIGYIAWVIIKSVFNTSNLGKSVSGMITRIGYIIGAGIYGGLALNAFQIAMHAGSGERNAEQTMSAMLLRQPFGPWLVSGIGAIIVGYGLFELYSGMTKKFLGKFNLQKMNEHERKVAEKSGKTGLISRGVVLALIGTFFIQTALSSNPGEAKGLDGALAEVSQQPFGQWLLGITALGLTLYGVYEITRGRYERMSFGK